MILQALRKNSRQAYLEYKALNDKKQMLLNLTNVLTSVCQRNISSRQKNTFQRLPLDWASILKNALLINNCVVCKIGTDKTRVLHCMRLRLLTPGRPIPDVQTRSQEYKLDLEFIIEHDKLHARGWAFVFRKLIFDNGQE